jgi:multiple sugar transport system substrate-binding protein
MIKPLAGATRLAGASSSDRPSLLSRRCFLEAAAGVMLGVALGACAGPPLPRPEAPPADPKAAGNTGEKAELVYQDWRTEWFPPMANRMLDIFQESHPNIRVFFTLDPENLEDKMLADFQAGRAPDVFAGCCTFFPIWAQHGYTLDLRPFVAADLDAATIQDWDPAQYAALFTRHGLQYALPKYHGALALYYNKDMFDDHRVSYPDASWDYDDYREAMRRLTADTNDDNRTDRWGSMLDVSWDRIQVHVNGFGGHFVDPENPTHCMMAEPEALDAMEWLRARMWDDMSMATRLDVRNQATRDAFAGGRLAMVEDGSWALRDILQQSRFRLGVAPFPAGPSRRATLATTDGFGIYSDTLYPDAAWELLKFLVGEDYGRAMAEVHFLQPARASLVDDWAAYIRDEYPEKTKDMDLAAFADGHIRGYSVVAEIFPNMEAAQRIAYDAWDRLFTLGQAGAEIMVTAAEDIQQAQDDL